MTYVSKGGLKLEKALKTFGIDLNQKKMVDIGSSTGGFCDCALQYGISHIVAIDVGKDQFAESLRNHPKIDLWEETDFRTIDSLSLSAVTIATIDVSFISLGLILPAVRPLLKQGGQGVCLVKPQFEAGREKVGKKGVVRDPAVHLEVLEQFLRHAKQSDFSIRDITFSPIKGPEGNIEYLGFLKAGAEDGGYRGDLRALVEQSHGAWKEET